MFVIHTLSTDKKHNLTLEVMLRGAYSGITSEKRLRVVLKNSIEAKAESPYKQALLQRLANNELLFIMRDFGMVTKTRIIRYTKAE